MATYLVRSSTPVRLHNVSTNMAKDELGLLAHGPFVHSLVRSKNSHPTLRLPSHYGGAYILVHLSKGRVIIDGATWIAPAAFLIEPGTEALELAAGNQWNSVTFDLVHQPRQQVRSLVQAHADQTLLQPDSRSIFGQPLPRLIPRHLVPSLGRILDLHYGTYALSLIGWLRLNHALGQWLLDLLDSTGTREPTATPTAQSLLSHYQLLCREHPAASVGDLAKMLGISRQHLHRLAIQTGESPGRTRQTIRQQRIEGMLAQGLDIAQIATKTGYASAESFSQAFHRRTGLSPTEWCHRHYQRSGNPPDRPLAKDERKNNLRRSA